MKPIVSFKDSFLAKESKISNSQKIIMALAQEGRLNKWGIKKKTLLPYPRIHENIVVLEKKGYVQVVAEKTAQNKLPSREYGITFKGALSYLSLIILEHPRRVGNVGESQEEFKKQFIEAYQNYIRKLNHLSNIVKTLGQNLDFEIFRQLDWLVENFGLMIFDEIIELARNQKTEQPNFFNASRKRDEMEELRLLETIKTIKEHPSLQKMETFWSDGKGKRETREIDVLKDEESRLSQLRMYMDLSLKNENKYWRRAFSNDFFERLAQMPKKKKERNESLAKLARELLEERRKTLISLEKIVNELEGVE